MYEKETLTHMNNRLCDFLTRFVWCEQHTHNNLDLDLSSLVPILNWDGKTFICYYCCCCCWSLCFCCCLVHFIIIFELIGFNRFTFRLSEKWSDFICVQPCMCVCAYFWHVQQDPFRNENACCDSCWLKSSTWHLSAIFFRLSFNWNLGCALLADTFFSSSRVSLKYLSYSC